MKGNNLWKMGGILIIILILVGVLFFSQNKENREVIRIGYLPITASLPLFIAQEKGYFTEQGLNVELVKFETSNQVIDSLVREDIGP